MKQKIFIFALALVMLLGAVPVREVDAAELYNDLDKYYTWREVVKILGFDEASESTSSYAVKFDNGTYPYYLICSVDTGNYYIFGFATAPGCLFTNSSNIYFLKNYAESVESSNTQSYVECCLIDDDISISYSSSHYRSFSITTLYTNFPFSFYSADNGKSTIDLIETNLQHEHSWISQEEPATCTETGRTWEECGCGEIQNETEIPALGHSFEQKEEAGSCTEDSRTWEECSVCGAVQNEIVTPSSGHVWIENEEPATCTEAGRTWEECGCGEIQNEVEIPALGHSFELKEEAGNCTEDSRTWEECSVCGAVQNEIVTPSSGHVWIENEESATCTEAGRTWEECGCGEIQNEVEIPALGHSFKQKEETGSCTRDSKTWEECSACGTVQNEVITAASGHVYDDDDDNICNACSYNRNVERSADFLDMMPIILTLFLVFPLNVFLIVQIIVLSVVLYRRLKKS